MNELSEQEYYEQKYLKYKSKYLYLKATQQGGNVDNSLLKNLTGGDGEETSDEAPVEDQMEVQPEVQAEVQPEVQAEVQAEVQPEVQAESHVVVGHELPLGGPANVGDSFQLGGGDNFIKKGYESVYNHINVLDKSGDYEDKCGNLLENINKFRDTLLNLEKMEGGTMEQHHFLQLSQLYQYQADEALELLAQSIKA